MRNTWLRGLHRHTTAGRPARRPIRFRPTVGRLEDRLAPAILTFQQGANGYTGTQDAEIFSAQPTTVQDGGTGTNISVDNQDGGGVRQGLVRFDNIFGAGANQIPLGSVINSATLTITATDYDTGQGVRLGAGGEDADLLDAIEAACALPLYLPPVRVNGLRLVDGGLRAALPLWAAR